MRSTPSSCGAAAGASLATGHASQSEPGPTVTPPGTTQDRRVPAGDHAVHQPLTQPSPVPGHGEGGGSNGQTAVWDRPVTNRAIHNASMIVTCPSPFISNTVGSG